MNTHFHIMSRDRIVQLILDTRSLKVIMNDFYWVIYFMVS